MYRRVVSLLLLPCLLLTQSAALLGHAQAGLRFPGHDLRPHFHTQSAPAGHDHSRHHHSTGGHHHDDDAPQLKMPITPDPEPQSDHDADAVYVSSFDVVVTGRSMLEDGADTSPLWATAAGSNFVVLWPSPSRHPAKWWHPPPLGSSCPLYILHLALLI